MSFRGPVGAVGISWYHPSICCAVTNIVPGDCHVPFDFAQGPRNDTVFVAAPVNDHLLFFGILLFLGHDKGLAHHFAAVDRRAEGIEFLLVAGHDAHNAVLMQIPGQILDLQTSGGFSWWL